MPVTGDIDDPGRLGPAGTATYPIVHLGTVPGEATWFERDLGDLASIPWQDGTPLADTSAVEGWVSAAVDTITDGGRPRAHVLATGPAAYGAIVLAARHPALVASLLLGDPAVDGSLDGYAELLASVRAPTLVIASVPDPGHRADQAQSIAGGIADGVFVVIDGARVPAHQERSGSFTEWTVAFTEIAEGLETVDRQEPGEPGVEEEDSA